MLASAMSRRGVVEHQYILQDVYAELTTLFEPAPDLFEELNQFIPQPYSQPKKDARPTKDILCRNVLIYGRCLDEGKGCAFNHDPDKGNTVSKT